MTVTEAIEIKTRTGDELLKSNPHELIEADRLSNEALKAISEYRQHPFYGKLKKLPGETEE